MVEADPAGSAGAPSESYASLDRKKQSMYVRNHARIQKSTSSKQMFKMAKKTLTDKMAKGRGRRREASDPDEAMMEISRCNSYDFDSGVGDTENAQFKERCLVPEAAVRVGMIRFEFILDTCAPGSVPDPLLIAALLDLVRIALAH